MPTDGDRLQMPATAPPLTLLSTTAALVHFEAGLHALSIGDIGGGRASPGAGLPPISVQITSPPSDRFDPVDIISKWGEREAWIGAEGETVVIRSPVGGGVAMITVYTADGQASVLPGIIETRRLDALSRGSNAAPDREPSAILTPPATQTIVDITDTAPDNAGDPGETIGSGFELVLRDTDGVERVHAIAEVGDGWSPRMGSGALIEAFGLTQLDPIPGRTVEYRARGTGGRDTAWTREPAPCGSRGRQIALTGFAIRLAHQHAGPAAEIIYRGQFSSGFVSPDTKDGEMCISEIADDPLVALSVRVMQARDHDDRG